MNPTPRLAPFASAALIIALASSRLISAESQRDNDLAGARDQVAAMMNPANSHLIDDAHRSMARAETMVVRCVVSPEGRVSDAKIVRGTGRKERDAAWLATVREARFTPRLAAGRPVEYTTTFEVTPPL